MSRKRSNGKTEADKLPSKLPPLQQMEVQYFNELVESSKQYSGLLQQKTQFEYVVKQLQEGRKKVQKGEIPLPVNITLIPKVMTYQESDKKKVLKMFDDNIKVYQQNLGSLESQLNFAHENFTESGIRNKEFLTRRFEAAKVKNIVPDRKIVEGEETLFEAEFSDLLKDPKKVEALKAAKKTAVKRNIKQKSACECESCANRK